MVNMSFSQFGNSSSDLSRNFLESGSTFTTLLAWDVVSTTTNVGTPSFRRYLAKAWDHHFWLLSFAAPAFEQLVRTDCWLTRDTDRGKLTAIGLFFGGCNA
jgi:hypothetical protein